MVRNKKQHKKMEKRDKKIYKWYVDFNFHKGKAPTIQEIGEHFGVTRERARQLLEQLVENGYLIKLPKRKWREVYSFRVLPLIEYLKEIKFYGNSNSANC